MGIAKKLSEYRGIHVCCWDACLIATKQHETSIQLVNYLNGRHMERQGIFSDDRQLDMKVWHQKIVKRVCKISEVMTEVQSATCFCVRKQRKCGPFECFSGCKHNHGTSALLMIELAMNSIAQTMRRKSVNIVFRTKSKWKLSKPYKISIFHGIEW